MAVQFKRYPVVTFLLFCIVLLWTYAQNRKTRSEWLAQDPDLIDSAAYMADPDVQRFMMENEHWLNSEEGNLIRARVLTKEIDMAIDQALERTKDNE
ncbi:MAG: hypothetical protein SF029_16205 [bacterium]|nr:hypothetical protein [bacterium]